METTSFNEEDFKSFVSNPNDPSFDAVTIDVGWSKAFENLKFSASITLRTNETYDKNIIFSNSEFRSINIEGAQFKELVWFKNCVFDDDFIIYNGSFTTLIFDNCDFKKGFTIYNIEIKRLSLNNVIATNPLLIKGGQLHHLSYVSINEKTNLKINGYFTFIEYFQLSTVIGTTVSISECIVNLISIEGDYNSASRVNIKEIKNNEISIKNVNNDGKFYFTNFGIYYSKLALTKSLDWYLEMIEDTEIKEEISHLLKYSLEIKTFLQLYNHISINNDTKHFLYAVFQTSLITKNINSNPGIVIQYSSLGTLELKQMDLKRYHLSVSTSDLSAIKLINTFFPINQKAWTFSDGFSVFIDLYSSASKQNNISDKIEYYKAAQKYLYKKIKTEKFSCQKVGSLATIIVSDFYSNHGSNWIRAAFLTVVVLGLPIFMIFIFSLKGISIDLSIDGLNFFFTECLQYFPKFLNPLHRTDFIDKFCNRGSWSGLIDLLSRIVVGIGVFEMVRSFRKFVRTS